MSAMALGEHLSVGAIGQELRDKSRAWLDKKFGLVAAEPSFLEPPVSEVASLLRRTTWRRARRWCSKPCHVLAWVKEDEATRKTELDRLLPLVRFPLMKEPATAMQAEPLVATKIIRRRSS